MKKKLIFVLLTGMSSLVLASCGNTESVASTTETSLEYISTVPEGFSKMDRAQGFSEVEDIMHGKVDVTYTDDETGKVYTASITKQEKIMQELQSKKSFIKKIKTTQNVNDKICTLESEAIFDFTTQEFSVVKNYEEKLKDESVTDADYVYSYQLESYGTWTNSDSTGNELENPTFTATEHANINISKYFLGFETSSTYEPLLEDTFTTDVPVYKNVAVDKTMAFSGKVYLSCENLNSAYQYLGYYAYSTPAWCSTYYQPYQTEENQWYTDFYKNADGDILMNFMDHDEEGKLYIAGFTLFEDGFLSVCGHRTETEEYLCSCKFSDEKPVKMEKTEETIECSSHLDLSSIYGYYALNELIMAHLNLYIID